MSDNANAPQTTQHGKPTFWANSHRIIFANAFSLRIGDNDCAIELCTEQNVNGVDSYFSEAQLMMTPKTAKILWVILGNALENFEQTLGPIAIPPEKMAQLKASMISTPPPK